MQLIVLIGVLLVACTVLAAILVALSHSTLVRSSEGARIVRVASAGAVAAVSSSMLYLLYTLDPSRVALALGDAAMVMAPALVWVAVASTRSAIRVRTAATCVLGLLVVLVSGTFGFPWSLVFKSGALTVICALLVGATMRGRRRGQPGSIIMLVTFASYAVFTVGRVAAVSIVGADSAVFQRVFGTPTTTAVGTVAVAAASWGVIRLARGTSGAPRAARRISTAGVRAGGGRTTTWEVAVRHYSSVRMIDGYARARALDEALVSACAAVGDVALLEQPGAVRVTLTGAPLSLTHIARGYGERIGVSPATALTSLQFTELEP